LTWYSALLRALAAAVGRDGASGPFTIEGQTERSFEVQQIPIVHGEDRPPRASPRRSRRGPELLRHHVSGHLLVGRERSGDARHSASKVEVACLERSKALCGGNQNCLTRLGNRVESMVTYGNSFGHCPGLK